MHRLLVLLGCLLALPLSAAPSVVFINPGKADEPFWRDAADAMQLAADSLGMQLEVLYAERDYLAQISLTREVAERAAELQPDYMVIAADKRTLPQQLSLIQAAGIKTLSAYNAVQGDERPLVGYPREHFTHWLGSVVPRAEDAGVLTARALMAEAEQRGWLSAEQTLDVIAISGDRSTDSSVRRNQGMLDAFAARPQVRVRQVVHGDWQRDKAAQQALHLFRRYPDVRAIWTGSDLMAFGAMQALREQGVEPGRDMLYSAVNASEQGMQKVIDGQLTALAGGHHMAGAWALVMLYDYHHGVDFADSEGTELVQPMFTLFTPQLAQRYIALLQPGAAPTDFCTFSKACNPQRDDYDFTIGTWLELGYE
ncbi:ABC transporter substrate-binding protein [Halopseudomonas salegens]|uniref:ABC transporter substrate-binding protein n=1 Tax=Halopseudomonas salegens TaxID=1434072 RepID=UPI0012FDBBD9|nr:ABC transporter substrate-binding protein [Halopseudomonas salegens]